MSLFKELQQVARGSTEANFVRNHQGVYLLGFFPLVQDEDDSDWSFNTDLPQRMDRLGRPILVGGENVGSSMIFVRRLQKTGRNPWERQIWVGRAANNDVVLRHVSVSKLHAYFTADPLSLERGETPPEGLELVDSGSAGGTLHNGHDAVTDEPVRVALGDHLRFGEIPCELLDAAALYPRLTS